MTDQFFHVSEIADFDTLESLPGPTVHRANLRRYTNKLGRINEHYDLVDEDGVVRGCGISTNVPPESEEDRIRTASVLSFERGVQQERERCAKIAEVHHVRLDEWGIARFQVIRRKHGAAIAARIRSGE
jgi:hypothetical protein